MAAVAHATLPIVGPERRAVGQVQLWTLPQRPTGLWDTRGDPDSDDSLEPVQLLEGQEYRYEFVLVGTAASVIDTDRPELFVSDKSDGLTGRLRPGLYTGMLPVKIRTASGIEGSFRLEIRSTKLDYVRDYRWMLRDVATTAAEVVMERFAPSQQRFAPDATRDPQILLQRFEFLKAELTGESFAAAIHSILTRPHISWDQTEQVRRPGQGWPGGSLAARQLGGTGRRVPAPTLEGALAEFGVPRQMRVLRSEPSVDNTPNRFVKFALTTWRELVAAVKEALGAAKGPSAMRGFRDVSALADQLDALLSEELFREVGELAHLPGDNQVLQKREGYRDILRTYLLCDVAAQLSWAGGDDVYGAGQKDVATLYEYWTFLQLGEAVATLCGTTFDWKTLLRVTDDGLGIDLKRGKEVRFDGTVERLGRTLNFELYYNRTFGRKTKPDASWSRPMRPDCSLQIRPSGAGADGVEPVWLHFDAKYRVESLLDVMPPLPSGDEDEQLIVEKEEAAERRGEAKRDDLLKMHAYRDAIRRSAGAYVLYPGTEQAKLEEYHELLPGLGAFALRPSDTGDTIGRAVLGAFLEDVTNHMALQISQHERGRYWTKRSYAARSDAGIKPSAAPFLSKPAADTRVLLGYVKNNAHFEWIRRTRRYNLRAGDRTGSIGLNSEAAHFGEADHAVRSKLITQFGRS